MSWFLASVLSASAALSAQAAMSDQTITSIQAAMADEMNVARRLIAAIQNKGAYQAADFIKPLGAQDKAFLSTYSRCDVAYVRHSLVRPSGSRGPYVQEPGSIALGWRCKGLPKKTPVHLTLLFREGKIDKIETHQG